MPRRLAVLFLWVAAPVALRSALVAPVPIPIPVPVPVPIPGPCAAARLVTSPLRPRRAALFRVRVEDAPDGAVLRGTAGGEPLHFVAATRARDAAARGAREIRAYEALAAAPIDSASPLRVAVACAVDGRVDSLGASVELTAADYPIERLRVAPRFSAPPDSALAARLRRESALAADVSRRAHDTPRLWVAPFRRPRDSRVTSAFGRGREFNGAITARHLGTDYAGAVGAPVRAANRGVVRLVDTFFLGGNVIYLDHGAGLVTAYLHLSAPGVAVGDTVERGAVIGQVGATGRVTGPHLHWITRYGAVTVDPASVLALRAASVGPR